MACALYLSSLCFSSACPAQVTDTAAELESSAVVDPQTEAREAPDCAQGVWDLQGANATPGPEATYRPEWTSALQSAVTCLERPELRTACLTIQGQFDAATFPDAVVSGYGSELATQQTRARGRAGVVHSRLHELGAPAHRLRELPPPSQASYRGVRVAVLLDCVPDKAPICAPAPVADPTQAEEPPTPESQSPPREPGPYFLQAVLGGAVRAGAPDTFGIGGLALGAGYQNEHWYMAGGGGLRIGSHRVQRVGYEGTLSGGVVLLPWWSVGGYVGYRRASTDFFGSWLDQAVFLGLESHQCAGLGKRLSLCVREGFVPLGHRVTRGVVVSDVVFQVPDESSHFFRLELGAVLRIRL